MCFRIDGRVVVVSEARGGGVEPSGRLIVVFVLVCLPECMHTRTYTHTHTHAHTHTHTAVPMRLTARQRQL